MISKSHEKLATFTKAGYGRNRCKRRCAKRVVHRNRNNFGLTNTIVREMGRERRERREKTRAFRKLEKMETMEVAVKIDSWDSAEPGGGADADTVKGSTTPSLRDPSSLRRGRDESGRTRESKSSISDGTYSLMEKRCVCFLRARACVGADRPIPLHPFIGIIAARTVLSTRQGRRRRQERAPCSPLRAKKRSW